jgi:hypothetical protein
MREPKGSVEVPSSFRDPSGFLFWQKGTLYRQVNLSYKGNYIRLMNSGLYHALVEAGLLVPHEEVSLKGPNPKAAYKVLKPEPVTFISYPYEWCFSQLKDAALTTLKIQKKALEFGMSLKDCSAFNIQFQKGSPVLLDTLSFERYREGAPWVAYRQFCQHFLAPLVLMSYKDVRLSQLLRVYIDGIPLDLASSLLPLRTRLMFPLLSHLHLHAQSQKHFADKPVKVGRHKVSRLAFLGILDSLESAVRKLQWRATATEWADYYQDTNYSAKAFEDKKSAVAQFLDRAKPKTVWDLGANVGIFSHLASQRGMQTIAIDGDAAAVERLYLDCKAKGETKILPLLVDLTNPTPAIGWENRERMTLAERGPADTVLALALLHHLAIGNNLPFIKVANFLRDICRSLIVEFIPKDDSQVRRLLQTREDIFPDYTKQAFEREFGRYFKIEARLPIRDSKRTLYLMRRNKK